MNLWQGPVPDERDMTPYMHYDWHWLWHWGNGELGNNGIHHLDILRWGLQVEYPQRVTYNGGRYWYDDKQETPDTGTAVFDFGKVGMEWVQSSCHPRAAEKPLGECVFYGEDGTFAISGSAWTIYDFKGAKTGEGKGPGGGDAAHIGNFLDAIRGNAQAQQPDRRRPEEHHALPPRQHRLPHEHRRASRSQDRQADRQSRGRKALEARVSQGLGAEGLTQFPISQSAVCEHRFMFPDRKTLLSLAASLVTLVPGAAGENEPPPRFAAMFDDASVFEEALAQESAAPPPGHHVTGITVPHHVVAVDLIARGFRCASGGEYERIILLRPIISGARAGLLPRRLARSRRSSARSRVTRSQSARSLPPARKSRNRLSSRRSMVFTLFCLSLPGFFPRRSWSPSRCGSTRSLRTGWRSRTRWRRSSMGRH